MWWKLSKINDNFSLFYCTPFHSCIELERYPFSISIFQGISSPRSRMSESPSVWIECDPLCIQWCPAPRNLWRWKLLITRNSSGSRWQPPRLDNPCLRANEGRGERSRVAAESPSPVTVVIVQVTRGPRAAIQHSRPVGVNRAPSVITNVARTVALGGAQCPEWGLVVGVKAAFEEIKALLISYTTRATRSAAKTVLSSTKQ